MDRVRYEVDNQRWPADAYRVKGYDGIAWHVYGWEVESIPCEGWTDTDENTGEEVYYPSEDVDEVQTGRVVCVMVGDDRRFVLEPDELTPLADDEYCAGCGQIGCGH